MKIIVWAAGVYIPHNFKFYSSWTLSIPSHGEKPPPPKKSALCNMTLLTNSTFFNHNNGLQQSCSLPGPVHEESFSNLVPIFQKILETNESKSRFWTVCIVQELVEFSNVLSKNLNLNQFIVPNFQPQIHSKCTIL